VYIDVAKIVYYFIIIIMNKFVLGHVACTVNLAKMVLIFPPMFWFPRVSFSMLLSVHLAYSGEWGGAKRMRR
ncbi:hypothetical protein L9F63_025873, partial [Diploptera punctata]